MKKYRIIIATVLGWLTFGNPAFAQEKSRFVGLSAGFTSLQIKDYFHSDYTYRGTGLGVQAWYGQERLKTNWQLDVGYAQATPQSIVSRKASTQLVDLRGSYQWRLSPAGSVKNRFHGFAGLGVRLYGISTNYSPDIEVRTVQTTGVAALGLSAKVVYHLNHKHRIQVQAFGSALHAVYRPSYPFDGRDQVGFSWAGKSPVADAQLTYRYQLSRQWQAVGSYHIQYFRYDQPRPVTGLIKQASVGIQRSF